MSNNSIAPIDAPVNPHAQQDVVQHATAQPYTPHWYLDHGLNVKPSQPHNPKFFVKGYGYTTPCTAADFTEGSIPKLITGMQPNSKYLIALDIDDAVTAAIVKGYLAKQLPDVPVAKSTNGKGAWAFLYSPFELASWTMVDEDDGEILLELKAARNHVNLPTSAPQMVHGSMDTMPELSEAAMRALLNELGYAYPKEHTAPAQKPAAQRTDTTTQQHTADPYGDYCQRHSLHDALVIDGMRLRGHDILSCNCGKHAHGDRNPSISLVSSARFGDILIAKSPACRYYNNGKPLNLWNYECIRDGESNADKLKREYPDNLRQHRQNTKEAERKQVARATVRDARLDSVTVQLDAVKLSDSARALGAALLSFGTLQVTITDREMVQRLGWSDGAIREYTSAATGNPYTSFLGDKRIERAYKALKASGLGTRSKGFSIRKADGATEYIVPVWTWNTDALKGDTLTQHNTVPAAPIRHNIPVSYDASDELALPQEATAPKVEHKCRPLEKYIYMPAENKEHAGIDSRKGKEEATGDSGACYYDPLLDVFNNPAALLMPSQPHEKPASIRRADAHAPLVFLDTPVTDAPQQDAFAVMPAEPTKAQKALTSYRKKWEAANWNELQGQRVYMQRCVHKHGKNWAKDQLRTIENILTRRADENEAQFVASSFPFLPEQHKPLRLARAA